MRNFPLVRTFEDGYSVDLKDNIERKNTLQKGTNGRLYSKNGTLSFSAIEGSKLVYENNQIVKYLGFYSFKDEFIVFAKTLRNNLNVNKSNKICELTISSNTFSLVNDVSNISSINISNEILENSIEKENCYNVKDFIVNQTDFNIEFSCEDENSEDIDLSQYYSEDLTVPNLDFCTIGDENIGIHNLLYSDSIYSFTLDEQYNLVGKLLWVGFQNWPINAKITTEGVDENEFYKRVHYTNAFNPSKVVNIKDAFLSSRSGNDFNRVLNNTLLQPIVKKIKDGGQLSAMKVLYVYRIISENGQLSEFSPSSEFVNIIAETDPIKYRGGSISENTGKSTLVICNILNSSLNSEIECVALEYEAFGPPTAIKNLGRKPARSIVEFNHFGNEAEFSDDINFEDIINSKNTWKYSNDYTSKKNKLIAAGLRNDPIPTEINNLEYLFPLHGWKEDGSTHNCLMNPKPWEYRFVDPTNTEKLIYIKQKVYETISSFGPLELTLKNTINNEEETLLLNDLSINAYTNLNDKIFSWLDLIKENPSFISKFPNLKINQIENKILFEPIDNSIQTDMSAYVFKSNNTQFIENFNNDIQFLNTPVNTSNLVYGAQSIGFNEGVGIRVTYRSFKRPLIKKANSVYDGTGKLLDYMKPTEETFCMKGEIYRLAFQAYNNDSTRYFSIPLGDVMIPNVGEMIKEIDDTGNPIFSNEIYLNQSVEGDTLYGHGIKMHIEVRLSCELKKEIPMFQILYVERTEDNRTILCQGISAPLNRTQTTGSSDFPMPNPVENKWNLPYYGGPTYEREGLNRFDFFGENYNTNSKSPEERIITHRSLMYFDSPDLYYNKISDQFVKTSKVDVIGKINTDHTPNVIRQHGGKNGNEVYPKFSRKILENAISGNVNVGGLPRNAREDRETGTWESYFINVSVFANYTPYKKTIDINKSETLERGEIISGSAFDLSNDVSNNTYGLPCQAWYYGGFQRRWTFGNSGDPNSSIFKRAINSPGYKTTILKLNETLFSDDFIGSVKSVVNPQIRLGGSDFGKVYDTLPLINIYRNNRESVFGGRSKQAFSKNTYIPLSQTIPTSTKSNGTQFFDVGADVYVTLNIRTKNDSGTDPISEHEMNNGSGRARGDITSFNRNAAWCYVVVLETQVEPKWTYQYEFYRESSAHNFEQKRDDIINPAYFNQNNLKSYVPKPFKFKDDPNQNNVIAVSDVKLAGEFFDSWTSFRVNNFYAELEKNKGAITNIFKENDEIYAIQEQQTSLIYLGTDRIVNDSEGDPINVKQGSGQVVDGHKVISPYGTSIRRAVVYNTDYGFTFFDERKNEFIKLKTPLLLSNLLHIEYNDRFKNNPVIDSEAYFDHAKKETNIRLRFADDTGYLLSYNEVLKKFNGEHEYDNDLYIMFDEKVYIPVSEESLLQEPPKIISKELHQLNEGKILNLANNQKKLILGIIINSNVDKVFQYKVVQIITDIDYPIEAIFIKSNLKGLDRTILGTHQNYQIREGTHSVPAINDTIDNNNISDVRGNQIYVELTTESIDNAKVSILAIVNNLRFSHQ